MNYKNHLKRIQTIFSEGEFSNVNNFEEIFIELECKSETSSAIIARNRLLIRNAYYLLILMKKNKGTIEDLQEILVGTDSGSSRLYSEFFKLFRENDESISMLPNRKLEEISKYFLTYYAGSQYLKSSRYNECAFTRYTISALCDESLINKIS